VARRLLFVEAFVVAACFGCTQAAPPRPVPMPPPAPLPAPPPPSAGDGLAECREQVAGLEDWLRAVESSGLPLTMSLLDEGSGLVEHDGQTTDEPAPLVHLAHDKAWLDGEPVEVEAPPTEASSVRAHVARLLELRRNMMPESPFNESPRCYLAVDNDVRWAAVARVVTDAEAAGIERVTFVFRDSKRTAPAPPASSIDDQLLRLGKASQTKRQQLIAELFAYVYQDCPEALKVIADMGANEVADVKQVILDELPDAIGACACRPDGSAVKALHWALFGNPRPTAGVTVRVGGAQSAASAIELEAERAWSEAHAEVLAAAGDAARQPLRFAVLAPPPPPPKRRGR
jgi:hypothetical protein